MKVNGKVIVVTGAGNGMGREITLELVRRGAKVAAVDMRAESLEETKMLSGGSVETFVVDITDAAKVAALATEVQTKFGQVDGLMNNAGIIQPFVKINDLTIEQADKVMNVNFKGPFMMTKAFLPLLLKRPEAHILNVSSMGSYAPVPGQSVYGASKAAIKLFTEGLRSELLDTNIGVTVVFPGAIATNIAANSGLANMNIDTTSVKTPKTTPAPIAAKAMVDAMEKNKPRICIGNDAKMLDYISRINPVYAAKMIYKQMQGLLK
jgi:NAD(P)-dependent dehydrogenase (short-subunit alcohol dehydrogenase family)